MEPDSQLSPALLKKVAHAAACSSSFCQAAEDLRVLAEVKISAGRVRRASERVGEERLAECRAAAEAHERLPLPAQQQSPGPAAPEVACVQVDGGRIQIRPRHAQAARSSAEGDSWWRETKVACLMRMSSPRHSEDPAPTIPSAFVDRRRMSQMVREIKNFSREEAPSEPLDAPPPETAHKPPEVVSCTVVATRESVEKFGCRLAAAAHAEGFAAAERKAFVADGAEANWGLWRRRFSHYTPILDWVHALCYVYAAALAGVDAQEGWAAYCRWAQWLWNGQVDQVLGELRQRQAVLGAPTTDDAETSPRCRVANALRYLANQRSRMNYPEYRRQGLPITSSHIESTIKRVNRRMKGTEKFWDQGAEPLLQLVADHLGPPDALDRFWKERPKRIKPQRCYQTAA